MAAGHGEHAGLQLADAEWLREVVVGAAFEADDGVGLAVARGEHQDRRLDVRARGPQRPTDGDTVEPGQHHVEDEQVEACPARTLQGGAAVGLFLDVEARKAEVQLQQFTNGDIVFHHERTSSVDLRHVTWYGCAPANVYAESHFFHIFVLSLA